MLFRTAKSTDLPALIAMIADDELGKKREDYRLPLPESYLKAFEIIEADPHQELIVLESSEGQIMGTLQISYLQYLTYQGGMRAQIEAVRIHREHRQKGLGKKLFQWAIQRAQDRGAHLVQLTTDKQRPAALQFYLDLGFQASHEGLKLHF